MFTKKPWRYSTTLVTLGAIVLGVVPVRATIASRTPGRSAIAQAETSLCRRVNVREGLIVRQRPDPNSPRIGSVEYNSAVYLVEGYRGIPGPDNRVWLEIVAPYPGYVSNGEVNGEGNLGPCSPGEGTATPPQLSTSPLCRKVNGEVAPQGIAVYSDASRFSTPRGNLPPNGLVLLRANSSAIPDKNGESRSWVEITSPVEGFISTENLILCSGSPPATGQTPPVARPQGSRVPRGPLCRQVEPRVAPQGLAIRARPSEFSEYVGGVEPGGRMTLVENYRLIPDPNGNSRNWVEILAPYRGFVSADNLIMCP
jgi:hypothetical protein